MKIHLQKSSGQPSPIPLFAPLTTLICISTHMEVTEATTKHEKMAMLAQANDTDIILVVGAGQNSEDVFVLDNRHEYFRVMGT